MRFFIFFFVFSSASLASNSQDISYAKKTITGLISSLLVQNKQNESKKTISFRVDQCEKYKIDWTKMILAQEKVEFKYTFNEGCDLEGSFTPKFVTPFPINLMLKNLGPYKKVNSLAKIYANLETHPIINLEISEGILSGDDKNVSFDAKYKLRLNPLANEKNRLENLGGEILIKKIGSRTTKIKEKIFIHQK